MLEKLIYFITNKLRNWVLRSFIIYTLSFLGDDAINESSYRYLTIDEMKSLGDDSLPLDITKEDRYDTTAGIIYDMFE